MAKVIGTKKAKEITVEKTEKPVAVKKDKNVGCPILGLGVNFYPSEEVRVSKVLTKKSYVGKIVLIISDELVKVGVEGIVGIFICKHEGDKGLNTNVDNSWAE